MALKKPSELDLAQIRLEFRRLYKDIGYEGSLQVIYELLCSANVLADIIIEERKEEGLL